MQDHPIRILGIDPGLRRTGWGAIACRGNAVSFLGAGTVTSDAKESLAERLTMLHAGLEAIIRDISPHEAAVELTFVNRDAAATLKLGQARGIALLAPAQVGIPVAEYAPNLVKKTIIGVGHGDKKQIRMMVKVLLPKAEFDSDDAADALAIALCHAQHRGARALAARYAEAAQ